MHSRKVTRDIASLDFLQNIPMRSETLALAAAAAATAAKQADLATQRGGVQPRNSPVKQQKRRAIKSSTGNRSSSDDTDGDEGEGEDDDDADDESQNAFDPYNRESLAGRRLPGFDATEINVPPLFRYRFTTKYPAVSAVVRRWEAMTAQQGLQEARMFFSAGCGYPIAVSTIIKVTSASARVLPPCRLTHFLFCAAVRWERD